jgi:hypothetical protein
MRERERERERERAKEREVQTSMSACKVVPFGVSIAARIRLLIVSQILLVTLKIIRWIEMKAECCTKTTTKQITYVNRSCCNNNNKEQID